MSSEEKQPHDQGYHDQEGHMQGWDMHHHQQMNYPYARMSPTNVPHVGQYGGGGAGGGHHMMGPGQGGGGGGYMSYPPQHGGGGQMIHPSYSYPPLPQQQQQQQQAPPGYYGHHQHHQQHGSHAGSYYPQYHPHPSQYSRNSPHPMEAESEHSQHSSHYYGYGGGYMGGHHSIAEPQHHPHPPGYGSMMHQHPHAGGHGMSVHRSHHQTPHHGPGHRRGGSYGAGPEHDAHTSSMRAPSSDDNRRSSYPTGVKHSNSDDGTITTAGVSSPPDIPPPPATQSGSISAISDKDRSPKSPDHPLGESHRHGNLDIKADRHHGSSEKKQTLDTASVLLAFSSTKKPRPASELSMTDDADSKCSFPTLPTEPSFSSIISEPPNDQLVLPAEYPRRLTTPDDEEKLNALHCYMRSELLEVVVIQPASSKDIKAPDAKNTPTSSDPQMIGRVGLRCVFCGMSQDGGRAGPSMSIFYPRTVSEIYRLVTSWKRCHLSKCRHLPPNVRQQLDGFKECRARGKTSYWVDSAHAIGMVDITTKIGGVRFQTDVHGVIQNTGRPSSQAYSIPSLTTKPSSVKEEQSQE